MRNSWWLCSTKTWNCTRVCDSFSCSPWSLLCVTYFFTLFLPSAPCGSSFLRNLTKSTSDARLLVYYARLYLTQVLSRTTNCKWLRNMNLFICYFTNMHKRAHVGFWGYLALCFSLSTRLIVNLSVILLLGQWVLPGFWTPWLRFYLGIPGNGTKISCCYLSHAVYSSCYF
jgi:hypothetical protein